MANEFINNLNKLQSSNFLGGVVQAAAARLTAQQAKSTQDTLNRVNEQVKVEDGNLKTTEEQLQSLVDNPEAKSSIDSIRNTAKNYQAYQESLAVRRQKYNEIYNKALTNLAYIGELKHREHLRY